MWLSQPFTLWLLLLDTIHQASVIWGAGKSIFLLHKAVLWPVLTWYQHLSWLIWSQVHSCDFADSHLYAFFHKCMQSALDWIWLSMFAKSLCTSLCKTITIYISNGHGLLDQTKNQIACICLSMCVHFVSCFCLLLLLLQQHIPTVCLLFVSWIKWSIALLMETIEKQEVLPPIVQMRSQ